MDNKAALQQSLAEYETQLEQITVALSGTDSEDDKVNLLSLRNDINQLINLTKESIEVLEEHCDGGNKELATNQDEYALFMEEMEKEGVVIQSKAHENADIQADLEELEGMKCKAPHKHQWGDTVYHNAMISSILASDAKSYSDIKVKIVFINPTHEEMQPCPFLLNTTCKFSDEQCRYSHGEIVDFSQLQEYAEPQFDLLKVGCAVLAKQSNSLWKRGTVKKMLKDTCFVKFDSNKECEVHIHETYPLHDSVGNSDNDDEESQDECEINEDIINTSLMNPTNQSFGDWEQHTKGFGSKLMQKMGYILGTGLGKNAEGRVDPVSAVILPSGKSLDFCMELREKSGGDKNLFSVEKKLKRLQKKQEKLNQRAYERERKKTDVFNFLNSTLSGNGSGGGESRIVTKSEHRQEIKKESSRNLNVASLQTEENMRKCNADILRIKQSLERHNDEKSQMNKVLRGKLQTKLEELHSLKSKAGNIKNEQKLRKDRRKLTIF